MPISQKILNEIDNLKIEEKMKNLMKSILQLEDDGVKRWNIQYESKIKEYLGQDTNEEE